MTQRYIDFPKSTVEALAEHIKDEVKTIKDAIVSYKFVHALGTPGGEFKASFRVECNTEDLNKVTGIISNIFPSSYRTSEQIIPGARSWARIVHRPSFFEA